MAFKDEFESVGAIWEKTTASGKKMLSIAIDSDVELRNGDGVIALRVDRQSDRSPHWRIYRKKVAVAEQDLNEELPF